ncbi:MAG: alkaline phosphatase family protein [Tissierellia bacterium]|nr:alkaline phosphatase family protein [Tissierellia bacterium]MDD4781561.1 alkaline phosphatase family protein [Tissierellia bacterium]
MKTILIILDGVSEDKIAEIDNKTPLEYAFTPAIDKIKSQGSHFKTYFYPLYRQPDSLNCILSILGVDEGLIPKNRAYLEALSAGVNVLEHEVVLRCNLISCKDNKLESFYGMGLSKEKKEELSLNIKNSDKIKFIHISDYRNLIVIKKELCPIELDFPPHEYVGLHMDLMLKDFKSIKALKDFIEENTFRILGRTYMFYPWGASEISKLPTFKELYNKSSSCVCHADIVKGIAKSMNINLAYTKNSTGDINTDLYEKSKTVLKEIQNYDTVIAHINGTDEVSHRKDLRGKIEFIEKIDKEFIKEIYDNINNDTKIIIVSDHQTSTITGKHEKGLVDVITKSLVHKNGRR